MLSQEIINDPRLFARGESKVYEGEYLEAISFPVGGMGSGGLEINGKAERHIWQIFNNFSRAVMPESFFGIRTKNSSGTNVKALQTSIIGPFEGMESLTFTGEFPIADYSFKDENIPVSVIMETFSPLMPFKARESATPAAVFSFKVTNTSSENVDVSLFGTQKNAVGYTGNTIYGEIGGTPEDAEILNDFNSENYGGWTATGTSFGMSPSKGTGPNQQAVTGFEGEGLVNTFDPNGDSPVGTLTSPEFIITKKYIYFLIGGGNHLGSTGVLIKINGSVVKSETGNDSETLVSKYWDMSDYIGQSAVIEVIDNVSGGWGHILVDEIMASDILNEPSNGEELNYFDDGSYKGWTAIGNAFSTQPSSGSGNGQQPVIGFVGAGLVNTFDPYGDEATGSLMSPDISITKDFIYFLIGGGNNIDKLAVRLLIDGEIVKSATGNNSETLKWHKWNISSYKGQTAKIEIIDDETGGWGHILVDQIMQSDDDISSKELENVGLNINEIIKSPSSAVLNMTTDKPESDKGFGSMSLLLMGDNISATSDITDLDSFLADITNDGQITELSSKGPSNTGLTYTGALNSKFTLAPGESKKVTFVLTWYFPNVIHGIEWDNWTFAGNMYTNWFANSLEVANYMESNYNDFYDNTKLFHDSFYESNLPQYILDRISSQTSVMKSKVVFWSKDGYFGGWEGLSSGNPLGHGNLNHVWHYAQSYARLFPEIARKMREESYSYMKTDGGLPHRQKTSFPAFDGQCGEIIASYREHLQNEDEAWLLLQWPKVKKSMDFVINKWDSDKDGVLHGGAWNTLDAETAGNNSWLGTLYLTALESSEKMAEISGDPSSVAIYKTIRESGAELQNTQLWNGEYYIQQLEGTAYEDYGIGCHIDQLLGEWWASQVGIKNHYPDERIKTALQSIFKYNYKDNFIDFDQLPRKFVDDNDAGVLMTTWPKGERPSDPEHIQMYADEIWSGQEYSLAATMISNGLLDEGFGVILSVSDRYNGKLRTGLSPYETWGYSGNPFGDEEWGKHYVRPMSIWSALISSQGFINDVPNNMIGFKPVWQPDNHKSFFTSGNTWGLFSQKKEGNSMSYSIRIDNGTLEVNTLIFSLGSDNVDVDKISLSSSHPIKSYKVI